MIDRAAKLYSSHETLKMMTRQAGGGGGGGAGAETAAAAAGTAAAQTAAGQTGAASEGGGAGTTTTTITTTVAATATTTTKEEDRDLDDDEEIEGLDDYLLDDSVFEDFGGGERRGTCLNGLACSPLPLRSTTAHGDRHGGRLPFRGIYIHGRRLFGQVAPSLRGVQ